ncbi:hypothetical protein, partial [Klebsiella pneumoniae]|uniref:hypothetical protein n=1 Tax=Klebsiella pneumoniae TaxID=573 RepID=UPI003012F7F1
TGCDKRRRVSLSWPQYSPSVNTTFGLDIPFYLTGDWEAAICNLWETKVFALMKNYYNKVQFTP